MDSRPSRLKVIYCVWFRVAQSHYSYNPDGLIIVSSRGGFRSTVLAVRVQSLQYLQL